jgi:S-phase kinase-associated protein 1
MKDITMSTNESIFTFKTSDGFSVETPKSIAMSTIARELLKDDDDDDDDGGEFPLSTINKKTLDKVLEFCHYQQSFLDPKQTGELLKTPIERPIKSANISEIFPKWYVDYLDVDQDFLYDIIIAANFLDIKDLLDLTCAKVASMIKGRTAEEIRKIFGIVNDFTEEEEEQLRKDNKWIEDTERN